MFKHILVPLDGSSRAERALPVAARLAGASGGRITLLQVVNTAPMFFWTIPSSQPYVQAESAKERVRAEEYLTHLRASPMLKDLPTEAVVLAGVAASTILAVATSSQVDLIILCSHGYTGMTRLVMGSVAEKVAHASPVPVLMLREGGPIPAGPHPDAAQPLRILVPLDGSVHAKAALVPAIRLITALAASMPTSLHLTRVVEPLPTREEEDPFKERVRRLQRAKKYLQKTTEHLQEGLITPIVAQLQPTFTWSVVMDSDVAQAVVRVAESGEGIEGEGAFGRCDLIAMATHGYGGLSRWTMGSVTDRVLHMTKLPILIVRPPGIVRQRHLFQQESVPATSS